MPSRRSVLLILWVGLLFPLSACGHRDVLPRSTSTLDVTWSEPQLPGGQSLGPGGQQHLTGAPAATIVHWLNGLTASSSSGTCRDACPYPMFYEAEPVFTFHVPAGTEVFACKNYYEVDVTLNGRPQRSLSEWSSSDFDSEAFMREALHVVPS